MRRSALGLIVVFVAALAIVGNGFAQAGPEFRLGFKVLADQIPEVVGAPLEDEHHGANGDSLQQTTTGLMAWRKADNWTAFTDGARTWVNGPSGIQERGNDERFDWEAPEPAPLESPVESPTPQPAAPTPTATPAAAPTTAPAPSPTPRPRSPVTVSRMNVLDGQDLHSGTVWVLGEARNEGSAPAYMVALSARLLSASGEVVGTGSHTVVYLAPGATVGFRVDVRKPMAYARAEVSVTSNDSSFARYDRLTVAGNAMIKSTDSFAGDIREYSGSVANTTRSPVQVGTLYAWFLDEYDNVLWADFVLAGPSVVAPGESFVFNLETSPTRYNPKASGINVVRAYAFGMLQP